LWHNKKDKYRSWYHRAKSEAAVTGVTAGGGQVRIPISSFSSFPETHPLKPR
jgi:hypothetical protein